MKNLIGQVIQFTKNIEDFEVYAENGMRARIVNVIEDVHHDNDHENQVHKIVVDYTEFDEFNKQFESSNYWDKNGQACLTAREAGFYKEVETLYFGSPELWPFEDYFTLLDEKKNNLLTEFKRSGFTNYVEWLESLVS